MNTSELPYRSGKAILACGVLLLAFSFPSVLASAEDGDGDAAPTTTTTTVAPTTLPPETVPPTTVAAAEPAAGLVTGTARRGTGPADPDLVAHPLTLEATPQAVTIGDGQGDECDLITHYNVKLDNGRRGDKGEFTTQGVTVWFHFQPDLPAGDQTKQFYWATDPETSIEVHVKTGGGTTLQTGTSNTVNTVQDISHVTICVPLATTTTTSSGTTTTSTDTTTTSSDTTTTSTDTTTTSSDTTTTSTDTTTTSTDTTTTSTDTATTSTGSTTSSSVLSSSTESTSTDPSSVGSGGLDRDDPTIIPADVGDDTLARTGTDSGTLLLLGGVLLIVGLLLVRYTRTD